MAACHGIQLSWRLCVQGQLCVLAEDCDQPDYKKLVEALCSEHNVNLLSVPEAKQLGQWAGVSAAPLLLPSRDEPEHWSLRLHALDLIFACADACNSGRGLWEICRGAVGIVCSLHTVKPEPLAQGS